MVKRFVIGDIHGRLEALKEVLRTSKFNYQKDKLIILGDVVDGGYNTYEVVEELLKIKNKIFVIGNHDNFFLDHMKAGWAEEIWLQQGGCNTLNSYGAKTKEGSNWDEKSLLDITDLNIPVTHQEFFNKGVYYYIEDNMLFVHGGFIPKLGVKKTSKHDLVWDRDLINVARSGIYIPGYDRVFVGHTTTQTYGLATPSRFCNLIMMDCGAGWTGKLAIMDIDTEEFWLSKKQNPARGTESENLKRMTEEILDGTRRKV